MDATLVLHLAQTTTTDAAKAASDDVSKTTVAIIAGVAAVVGAFVALVGTVWAGVLQRSGTVTAAETAARAAAGAAAAGVLTEDKKAFRDYQGAKRKAFDEFEAAAWALSATPDDEGALFEVLLAPPAVGLPGDAGLPPAVRRRSRRTLRRMRSPENQGRGDVEDTRGRP